MIIESGGSRSGQSNLRGYTKSRQRHALTASDLLSPCGAGPKAFVFAIIHPPACSANVSGDRGPQSDPYTECFAIIFTTLVCRCHHPVITLAVLLATVGNDLCFPPFTEVDRVRARKCELAPSAHAHQHAREGAVMDARINSRARNCWFYICGFYFLVRQRPSNCYVRVPSYRRRSKFRS